MARKIIKSKKNVKLHSNKTKINIDPVVSITLKLLGGALFIMFLFLSVYSNLAGSFGIGFKKWILAPFFGDGLYYLPFISIYLYYAIIIHKKNKNNWLKIVSSICLALFISAGTHMLIKGDVTNLELKYLSSIISDAQASKNGGIFGTYIADTLRILTGPIFTNILIFSINLAAIFIMFNEIIGALIKKSVELIKNIKKDKTTRIFRVPGVKIDRENIEEVKSTKKPEDYAIPINNNNSLDTDVIIEKFSDTVITVDEPITKEPALTKKEVKAVINEIETAKQSEIKEYSYPKIEFLNQSKDKSTGMTKEDLNNNATKLINTLRDFGVDAEIINIQEGPAVTRYEIRPQIGVKISKIMGLSEDIALRMAAKGIRIAPIPGKTVIGVEIANQKVMPVFVRDVIVSNEFREHKSKIAFALGKDIAGTTIVGDIGKMPHCLIAGATGSGKSVCVNSLITSILYKASPDEVKLIMIDPKVVELSVYNGIPHLLIPVVTDPRKAAGALNWAVMEMLNRYNIFAKANVRDLESYNEVARENGDEILPRIVIIVDELADLMVASPKEVEEYICRLAQLARAAGMHLIIATQRPSVDVITGLIKANIPSRIAFAVSSQIDSRTILDMAGAEKLLGKGDMLYAPIGESKPIRVQGALISDKEVEKIVTYLKENMETTYDDDVISHIEVSGNKDGAKMTDDSLDADEMLPQCIEFVVDLGEASVSKLQRRFKLGYSRAARIVDQMEERGIVGPSEGSKARQVLISKDEYLEMSVTNPNYV